MRVKIPFNDRFILSMGAGRKTMTTRSKRYGRIGDTFWLKGMRFKLLGVERRALGEIVDKFYKQEGFNSRKDFIDFWLTIHRKFAPSKKFYLHTFRRG